MSACVHAYIGSCVCDGVYVYDWVYVQVCLCGQCCRGCYRVWGLMPHVGFFCVVMTLKWWMMLTAVPNYKTSKLVKTEL